MKVQKSKLDVSAFDVESMCNAVNAEFGEGTLVLASDVEDMPLEMIPSGIYTFDFATGGGIPKRKVSEFNGPFSSFKSTIAWKFMASHLAQDKKVTQFLSSF